MSHNSNLRFTPALQVKFANVPQGDGEFKGAASLFGGAPDAYGDVIAPNAFQKSLSEHRSRGTMPAMLWAHDPSRPIGRWVDLEENAKGLFVTGQFNLDTTAGREAHAHAKAGDVTGLSIGFNVPSGGQTYNKDGTSTLTEIILHEVSVVAIPAHSGARISAVKSIGTKREFEEALREIGFPKAAAAKLSAHGWAGLDAGDDTEEIETLLRAVKASTLMIRNA